MCKMRRGEAGGTHQIQEVWADLLRRRQQKPVCEETGSSLNEAAALSQRASPLSVQSLCRCPGGGGGGAQGFSAAVVSVVSPTAFGLRASLPNHREAPRPRFLGDEGHRVLEFLLGSADPDL